jgi:DNA mismatch endonuclease (patch repair protein)
VTAFAAVGPVDLRCSPPASSEVVRARFRRQGRRDTVPELAVRRRLHARGVRFRVDVRPCRETRARGDLVCKGRRVIVFVDGRRIPLPPTARTLAAGPCRGTGAAKLAANVARDRRTDALLTGLGWRVLRFWEHQDVDEVVDAICAELGR